MAAYGERDPPVPPDQNAPRLTGLVEKGGGEVLLEIYPEADHRLETPARMLEDGTFRFPAYAMGYLDALASFLQDALSDEG